jgi:hypothetical protein
MIGEQRTMNIPRARNARHEAQALVPSVFAARVLEPSPPANTNPIWCADDPTAPGDGRDLITPVPSEGATWAELGECDAAVATFAWEHWLDGIRPLESLPAGFSAARRALHQIGFFAVAPTRYLATGKLGLRYTHRGFGTPFFRGASGTDEQVRVEGDVLVHQVGASVRSAPITTVADAADLLGLEYRADWFEYFHDPLAPIDPATPLLIDEAGAESVGAWFGFATHVLERFRRRAPAEVSRVQLWPEHFDPAIDAGSAESGGRGSFGASPGDDSHPDPYLYVAPWGEFDSSDAYWNATAFGGAYLPYEQLRDSDDPYATALDFFTSGVERLADTAHRHGVAAS